MCTHTDAPGLVCGIEANQYRSVDVRVPQAEVQLTCHEWSLSSQKSIAHKLTSSYVPVCKIQMTTNRSDLQIIHRKYQ